jgi:glycosyltransferase involved in cell wall biosynthesis
MPPDLTGMPRSKLFIGMPVYNGAKYMREALDSLLGQTFTDFTILISDDASTDDTAHIAEGYVARDARVKYVRQAHNLGMFGNFKFVLDQADAEYFMWQAQDDVREPSYLQVCIEKLNEDKLLGLATTTDVLIDSFGRILAEESDIARLSGTPSLPQLAHYIFLAEGLGKANIMYGVWRTNAARAVWDAYPQRKAWGQDYHVALALITRYPVYVGTEALFKKRLGGYSSPDYELGEKLPVKLRSYKDRNTTFPFRRFLPYIRGQREALSDTRFLFWGTLFLWMRLPYSFFIYMKERNYKNLMKRLSGRSRR